MRVYLMTILDWFIQIWTTWILDIFYFKIRVLKNICVGCESKGNPDTIIVWKDMNRYQTADS